MRGPCGRLQFASISERSLAIVGDQHRAAVALLDRRDAAGVGQHRAGLDDEEAGVVLDHGAAVGDLDEPERGDRRRERAARSSRACPLRPPLRLPWSHVPVARRSSFIGGISWTATGAPTRSGCAPSTIGSVPPPLPPNFIARTPNSSGLKKMYQGNSAQISPSVTPSAATVRSLRRSRLLAVGWAVKGIGLRLRLNGESGAAAAAAVSRSSKLVLADHLLEQPVSLAAGPHAASPSTSDGGRDRRKRRRTGGRAASASSPRR